MTTTNTSSEIHCPYCGKPYRMVTIPALWGIPERTFPSKSCGCEGEIAARRTYSYNQKLETREKTLRVSGIPKRYWDIPADDTYLEAIENGGLFLYGDVGRGKTYLAIATMKAWMNRHRGERALFVDSSSLFTKIREAYSNGESERDAIWRFSGVPLLVYDDFGKGKPSEWSIDIVEQIVKERCNEMRPCVFTSQWAGKKLISRLADGGTEESASAIVSRIFQMCEDNIIHLEGPDRRLQGW